MKPGRALVSFVSWLLYAPALLVLAVYGWGFLAHAWSVVSDPYQIDYGELPELNRAVLLAQGRPIYVDWSRPPYQMANYPPLYSAVAAAGVALFGQQFFTGRLLSLASTLVSGLCLGLAAASLGAGRRGGLVAALLFFAGYPVWNWGAFQRVDNFAVALEVVGLAVFAAGWVRQSRPAVLWATVPLFLAATFARQTVIAGAFACYTALLFRRPRLALLLMAAYAAGGVALFGLLQWLTGGRFWQHVVAGNVNRWSWENVDFYWQPFWRLLHWTFPLAAVAALAAAARRESQVPALYLLAGAATALTIGKIGSNVNYLLQGWAGLSLMAGLAAGHLDRPPRWFAHPAGTALFRLAGSAAAGLWLLVGLQQAFHVPYTYDTSTPPRRSPASVLDSLRLLRLPLWRLDPWSAPPAELGVYFRQPYLADPGDDERVAAAQAQRYIAALDGDVLSEDMAFTITTGKRIYLQPFEFTQLAEQGQFDQAPILEDIRRRHFTAVVLRFRLDDDPSWHRQRVNQPMIDALAAGYRLDAVFGDYFIYRPALAT